MVLETIRRMAGSVDNSAPPVMQVLLGRLWPPCYGYTGLYRQHLGWPAFSTKTMLSQPLRLGFFDVMARIHDRTPPLTLRPRNHPPPQMATRAAAAAPGAKRKQCDRVFWPSRRRSRA